MNELDLVLILRLTHGLRSYGIIKLSCADSLYMLSAAVVLTL